ncbi:hypothetical protein QYF36_010085 [Acer negundo]|nr:hypothetical protein QYF36_010085 [Acer negundo]
MYESVTMVNMKFLVSSATVFSKQDARGDERVSALRQDGEDFQSKAEKRFEQQSEKTNAAQKNMFQKKNKHKCRRT